MDSVLVRYSELALKGGNRVMFEKRLVRNIRDCLKRFNHEFTAIVRPRGRIIISTNQDFPQLRGVFGISSYSFAKSSKTDIDEIKKNIASFFPAIGETFRVTVKRIDKGYPTASLDMEKTLGAFVVEHTKKKVSLKSFDTEIGVDIVGNKAYVFSTKVQCFGGLPLGIGGTVTCLINGRNDILASWLMMRRGIRVLPIAFHNHDISIINKYDFGFKTELLIVDSEKDVVSFANKIHSQFMVTGETLRTWKDNNIQPTLMPLVSYSESDILNLERSIS